MDVIYYDKKPHLSRKVINRMLLIAAILIFNFFRSSFITSLHFLPVLQTFGLSTEVGILVNGILFSLLLATYMIETEVDIIKKYVIEKGTAALIISSPGQMQTVYYKDIKSIRIDKKAWSDKVYSYTIHLKKRAIHCYYKESKASVSKAITEIEGLIRRDRSDIRLIEKHHVINPQLFKFPLSFAFAMVMEFGPRLIWALIN